MKDRRNLSVRVLAELGFASTDAALQEMALLNAASELARYEEECERFEKKYGMPFERFRRRIEKQRGQENFAVEDDLMAWRFAWDGATYWKPRVEELRRAS